MRAGIDGDEKEMRELVFGKNLIEIKEKTVPQLLLDEVCEANIHKFVAEILTPSGISSVLRLSNCESDTLVDRSVLLLRRLYLCHISYKHHYYSY